MPKKSRRVALQLRGKVLSYNISQKGHIEGVLIETAGGVAQLNFPKHAAEAMIRGMSVGSNIDCAVVLEHDGNAHPVYRPSDDDGPASGTILRLNYSLHGETNGFHLDDGTFVHVKPAKASRYNLCVEDKVIAIGTRRPSADTVVLDAKTVNKVADRTRK